MNKYVVATLFALMMPLLVAASSMSIWQYGLYDKPTENETRINNAQIGFLCVGIAIFLAAVAYLYFGPK